jgi:hypothetical protein
MLMVVRDVFVFFQVYAGLWKLESEKGLRIRWTVRTVLLLPTRIKWFTLEEEIR